MKHLLYLKFSAVLDLRDRLCVGMHQITPLLRKHVIPYIDVSSGLTDQVLYEKYLFSESRMAYKLSHFEKLCLPSLLAQYRYTDNWKLFIVLTKNKTPEYVKKTLTDLTLGYPNIQIEYLDDCDFYRDSSFKALVKSNIPKNERYSITTLADDDGISESLLERVEFFAERIPDPFVYTAPNLYHARINLDGTIDIGDKWVHPNTHGAGLVSVDCDIFDLGIHYKIAREYPHLKIVRDLDVEIGALLGCDVLHTASLRDMNNKSKVSL